MIARHHYRVQRTPGKTGVTLALPQGRQIYARRLAIVEPVFANLRVQKRPDHFTVRSKAKVDMQWKLFALVHNIGKIQQYGRLH